MRTRENINDSLGIYLNQIAQIPLLTESEEKELARSGNIEKLIEANLRLVVHWALSYTPNATQSTLDLIQEGNIGLVKAAHRYNPDKGYKFSTYASWWIRQAISQSINDNSKTIRLPNNIVTELNLVNKTTNNLTEKFNREPSSKEISGASGISLERLDELNEYNQKIVSLNDSALPQKMLEKINNVEDTTITTPEEYSNNETLKNNIHNLLNTLNPIEKYIIESRYGLNGQEPKTFTEIGKDLNKSREFIRRSEAKAIRKLRSPVRANMLKGFDYDK